MSKDPAAAPPKGGSAAKLALCVRRYSSVVRLRFRYGVTAFVCGRLAKPKLQSSEGWWSRSGSNRRPEACKATALPTELRPHSILRMVGPGRLELPTLRLSGVRSNHLSYGPSLDHAREAGSSPGRTLRTVKFATLTREYVACEERETKAAKFRIFGRLDLANLVPMKTR